MLPESESAKLVVMVVMVMIIIVVMLIMVIMVFRKARESSGITMKGWIYDTFRMRIKSDQCYNGGVGEEEKLYKSGGRGCKQECLLHITV